MNKTVLHNVFRPISVYSTSIFIIAIIISISCVWHDVHIPSTLNVLLGIISLLLVWHFGLKFPYIGLMSMERLVQFHLLLTISLLEVIMINMVAGLIMPFINKSYRLDSYRVALERGLSNAGMNALMMLAGGLILQKYIDLPLEKLSLNIFLVIMLCAVVIQIVNVTLMSIYHTIDKKNFRNILTPVLVYADLLFVPIGVLSAMLYSQNEKNLFYLFVWFVFLILISFKNKQVTNKSIANTEYQSDYYNISSVCTSILKRVNQLFSYDSVYLGSYHQENKLLDLYIKQEGKRKGIISEKKLIELSQLNDLENVALINGNKRHALITSPFVDTNGKFAFICLLKESQELYSKADINLFRLLVQRNTMGLSYAITFNNLSQYRLSLESMVNERTKELKKANYEKSLLVNELRNQANRDGLTGLYNRRYFDQIMKKYSESQVDELSIAVIDIDYFKRVNDNYGHEIGDNVLQQIAIILNKNIIDGMKVIRYGGEEFVLIVSGIQSKVMTAMCQELIYQVELYDWGQIIPDLKLTISIGLAGFPQNKMSQLFNQADKYLYKAKNSGRNQLQYD